VAEWATCIDRLPLNQTADTAGWSPKGGHLFYARLGSGPVTPIAFRKPYVFAIGNLSRKDWENNGFSSSSLQESEIRQKCFGFEPIPEFSFSHPLG